MNIFYLIRYLNSAINYKEGLRKLYYPRIRYNLYFIQSIWLIVEPNSYFELDLIRNKMWS